MAAHNFNHPSSYDSSVPRHPVDSGARKMMAKQAPLDLTDPRAREAVALCERMRGAGVFARGVSAMEVASLICSLLPEHPVTVVTESPELLKLKRDELASRHENANIKREELKFRREKHLASIAESQSFLKCFKDAAKELMDPTEYSMLWDFAKELMDKRIATPDQTY